MTTLQIVEYLAAALALVYVFLIAKQLRVSWIFYIASSVLYLPIFWYADLYGYTLLQIYFIGMGIFGWYSWGSSPETTGSPLSLETGIRRLGDLRSFTISLGIILASLLVGYYLVTCTHSEWGNWDAFLSVGSVVTTLLTARKIFESWYLWIVINITATAVFAIQGLTVTAILYALYTVLSVRALLEWRKSLGKSSH